MQEGDYMVNIDGVNFNGNNEEDVSPLATIQHDRDVFCSEENKVSVSQASG